MYVSRRKVWVLGPTAWRRDQAVGLRSRASRILIFSCPLKTTMAMKRASSKTTGHLSPQTPPNQPCFSALNNSSVQPVVLRAERVPSTPIWRRECSHQAHQAAVVSRNVCTCRLCYKMSPQKLNFSGGKATVSPGSLQKCTEETWIATAHIRAEAPDVSRSVMVFTFEVLKSSVSCSGAPWKHWPALHCTVRRVGGSKYLLPAAAAHWRCSSCEPDSGR